MRAVLGLFMALLLAGCASSHVLVGQVRPPISAEQVKIYLEPPARYETVALLEASNRGRLNFTDQGRTNTVIWRLKEEAAALGANGVLLQGIGDQYAGSIGTGNAWAAGNGVYGVGFSSAVTNRVGSGLAIYVPEVSQSADEMSGAIPASRVDATEPVERANQPSEERFEPDPAKRCIACERLRTR